MPTAGGYGTVTHVKARQCTIKIDGGTSGRSFRESKKVAVNDHTAFGEEGRYPVDWTDELGVGDGVWFRVRVYRRRVECELVKVTRQDHRPLVTAAGVVVKNGPKVCLVDVNMNGNGLRLGFGSRPGTRASALVATAGIPHYLSQFKVLEVGKHVACKLERKGNDYNVVSVRVIEGESVFSTEKSVQTSISWTEVEQAMKMESSVKQLAMIYKACPNIVATIGK